MEENLTPWEKFKKAQGETRPWDFANPTTEYASKEDSDNRYSICLECPSIGQTTKICSECKCFMPAKVKLAKAKCPLGKW
jgi:hypothetical protein